MENKDDIINKVNNEFADSPDIIRKKVYIEDAEAYFIYVEGLIDRDLMQRDFIKPIIAMKISELMLEKNILNLPELNISFINDINDINQIVTRVVAGETVFICNKLPYGVSCKDIKYDQRKIEMPVVEKNMRGPNEGFIESLSTNVSILRRKVKNNKLKFKNITVGTMTNQTVSIAYIDGLCDPEILAVLYEKIKKINFDGMMAIGYIEQAIVMRPNSLFPQYQVTERPDKAVAALLEGRLVILMDGTPVVLIAPVSFVSFYQALDDYSSYWIHGTFLRVLRFLALSIAVLLPALYTSVTTFHYYAVPLSLITPLAESRSKVPFTPLVEVLILEITIEMVREAAVRLPSYIVIAISIVAGIVIGQAAVEAGLVSNLLIVIVAVTAVASYVIPSYDMTFSIRILKFSFIISAGLFGLVGIIICFCFTLAHLVTLDSLGQPYLQPFAPFKAKDIKDTLIRAPLKYLSRRPSIAKPKDTKRGKD